MAGTPLATAFVRVRPDTSRFKAETEAGVAKANLGAAGRKHGRTFGLGFSAAAGAFMGVAAAGAVKLLARTITDARNLGIVPLQQAAKNAGIEWGRFAGQLAGSQKTMERLGFSNAEVNASLTRLVTTTGKQGLSMRALGVAADLARFKHISLSDAAVQLGRAAAGNTRALKDVGIATNMLPKNFATTGTAASRLDTVLGLMSKRVGGQAQAYAGTFGGKLDILKAKLTDTSAKIGVAMLPVMSKLADMAARYLVPALGRFSAWMTKTGVPALQRFATWIGPKVSAFISVFAAGLGAVIRFASRLPGPLKVAGIAVIALGVAMRLAAAANPWLLVAAAIVTVVGIIVKNWPKISEAAGKVIGWIRGAWDKMVQALRNAFAWVVDKILGLFGSILHGAASAFGWVPGLGGKLRGAAAAFDRFRKNVNDSLRGINDRTVSVSVRMAAQKAGTKGGKFGANPLYAAAGGLIRGRGGPRDDLAGLYALSDREYVVQAAAVEHYGVPFLEALNARRLAGGGLAVRTAFPRTRRVAAVLGETVTELAEAFAAAIRWALPAAVTGAAQQFARAMLGAYGWGAGQWPALRALWMGESGWRWNARNPSSGAYGIPQALPASKMASAGRDWLTNAATQIRWGLGYIRDVYGSPGRAYAAWLSRSPHWYGRGGLITEPTLGLGLRTGSLSVLGDRGTETVTPGGDLGRKLDTLAGLLSELISAVDDNADRTAAGVAGALGGAARSATYAAMYSAR